MKGGQNYICAKEGRACYKKKGLPQILRCEYLQQPLLLELEHPAEQIDRNINLELAACALALQEAHLY